MLSEDFILAGQTRRDYDDWYREEIVNNEMYKTLFFSYKGQLYQFEPYSYYCNNETIETVSAKLESYVFTKKKKIREYERITISEPIIFDSFKDAIDNSKMDDNKTFKEIWDDPESEYLDFT